MKKRDLKNLTLVEQTIEDRLRSLIQDSIGQCPGDISCTFIGKYDIAILIEDIGTPLDEVLGQYCPLETVQKYHKGVELAIGGRVQRLVEEILDQPISKLSTSCEAEAKWMGVFILV